MSDKADQHTAKTVRRKFLAQFDASFNPPTCQKCGTPMMPVYQDYLIVSWTCPICKPR